MATCLATPIPPFLGTFAICVALPLLYVAQFVDNFSVWVQDFFDLARGWSAGITTSRSRGLQSAGDRRCAHRIPLSYRFPGKLSILILFASLTLLAGLSCFFFGCPPCCLDVLWSLGSSVCCGSVPIFYFDDLPKASAERQPPTLLPCLHPISCVHTCLVACPRTVLAPVAATWFPGRGRHLHPGHPRPFTRSSSVVTNKSPGQDITSHPFSVRYPHGRNGSTSGLRRCDDFFNFACVLLTSSGQVSRSWRHLFQPYSSLSGANPGQLPTHAHTLIDGSRLVHERRSEVSFSPSLDGLHTLRSPAALSGSRIFARTCRPL